MAMNFDPFRELDRMASALMDQAQGPRLMPMDLYREGDHYVLNADLPGIDPGSVDIDVDGELLTIRAERSLRGAEGVQWLARERRGGSFLRQLTLGQGIDTAGITATYTNGVLSVTIPVTERAKPRKIEVTSGETAGGQQVGQGSQVGQVGQVGQGGQGAGHQVGHGGEQQSLNA